MSLPAQPDEAGQSSAPVRVHAKPLVICLLLAVVTLAVFQPAMRCGFLNYDDPEYFSANPRVLTGLTAANCTWAFTTGYDSNWHPLTWLSLMLDADVFGENPAGPHGINLVFHAANTALLFLLLRRLTKATWRSAMVAALFALHPAHVESVAWVAERKDVLSAFFGLSALLAYACYAQNPVADTRRRSLFYLLSLFLFALGLMSKPMLVTLPFVMLLLDWWPLERMKNAKSALPYEKNLWLEKWPFFLLSALAGIITFIVQQKGGAVATMAQLPLSLRLENAFVSYARYLGKAFWPVSLANPYPPPAAWPASRVFLAAGLFAILCAGAIKVARKYPYAFTGWYWFAGMLVPVIGLIQVGDAALADRYTYLPLTGIFIIVVWGAAEMRSRWNIPQPPMILLAAVILVACSWRTREQLSFWQNSGTLFQHTLAVTKDNYIAENNLGTWFSANGRNAEALACFQRSLQIHPENAATLYNLGNALARQGQWDEAVAAYRHALRIKPENADALNNLGSALAATKRLAEAAAAYMAALELKPDFADAHNNLGSLLFRQGDFSAAAEHFYAACHLSPGQPVFFANLGDALVKLGDVRAAAASYRQALQLDPDNQRFKAKLQALHD
jgi:Flp pilus assembly protein TadD